MEKEKMILFENKKDCCGCGVCVNVCPQNAIVLKENDAGFLYPEIDYEKCILCGKCKKTCAFQQEHNFKSVDNVYVAACKEHDSIKRSASGGVFYIVANDFIEHGGIVYGCALLYEDESLVPKHIRVVSLDELKKLQGSKYVKSETSHIYQLIKKDIDEGKQVLFSGTPCQVDALYYYLGKRNIDNLFTVDIICHGVPSVRFFQSYIAYEEKKKKKKIVRYDFRDKSVGWGLHGKIEYNDGKNRFVNPNLSAYYRLFLNAETYRENCYECKYANSRRVGDITLGDYWGIENVHPEYLIENGGVFDIKRGVSCLIVNSEKGNHLVHQTEQKMILKSSTFENVAMENQQLKAPCKKSERRNMILQKFIDGGYEAVDSWYRKQLGMKIVKIQLWELVPISLKKIIKRYIR